MEEEIASIVDGMVRGFYDDIQRLCEEVCMEKVPDWKRWLPRTKLPQDKAARFKPGQVWAFSCSSSGDKYFDPIVFRVPSSWRPGDRVDALERPRYPDSHPFINDGRDTSPTARTQRLALIQDVDQPEPTPPHVLYGEAKTKETTMSEDKNWQDNVDWKDHIPAADTPAQGPIDRNEIKRGQVYAYCYNHLWRGVVRVTEDGKASTTHLLAHTAEKPQKGWGVNNPMICGTAWLIADENGWVAGHAQTHRRPAPTAKSKGKREVSVDGQLYIPYDSMADSDPFESYPYYRVKEADGSFSIDERPVALAVTTIDHCYECGSKQGPFGYTNRCYPCYERQENTKAVETRKRDIAYGSQVRRMAPVATTFMQSHATAWGGVFNIGT